MAILKHTNPCGVGSDPDLREAWEKAFATDKQAPFGGVIVCNRAVNEALAKAIGEIFSEVIIAPSFEAEARGLLQKKKNLRLIRTLKASKSEKPPQDIRSVTGGLLVQDKDSGQLVDLATKVVSTRKPTDAEMDAMIFGWRVVRHVKSNAIVYAAPDRTLGIGAGQMSRVDASRIAMQALAKQDRVARPVGNLDQADRFLARLWSRQRPRLVKNAVGLRVFRKHRARTAVAAVAGHGGGLAGAAILRIGHVGIGRAD